MGKLLTTFGSYVGFINPKHDGRLLLVRRTQTDSIIPGVSFKGNWELPGGAVEEVDQVGYNYAIQTAFAKAKDKVGIDIPVDDQPFLGPAYGTFFKGPQAYDFAQVVPHITFSEPTVGETQWVSPAELETLALAFISETIAKNQGLSEAQGLLSGKGKRMYLMALYALTRSSNRDFMIEAANLIASSK